MNGVEFIRGCLAQLLDTGTRIDQAFHEGSPDVRPVRELFEDFVLSIHPMPSGDEIFVSTAFVAVT